MIATLPTVDPTTTPIAEVRDWEFADEADNMVQTTSRLSQVPTVTISSLDSRVRQLIEGDYDEGPEELMGTLQTHLQRRDRRLADQLTAVALSERYDSEARSLALETLAAARVKALEPQAVEAVRVALEAPHPRLQFAGIAALSDLSRRYQISLSRVVRELVNSPTSSTSVQRAGAAFLRRRVPVTVP